MSKAVMTPSARIEAAISLNSIPDRIPLCPQIDYMAAIIAGKTCAEFASDVEIANECIEFVFEKLGGWDWLYSPSGSYLFIHTFFMEIKVPGKGLSPNSPHQIIEKPIMQVEDYDYIIKNGYKAYKELILERLNKKLDLQELSTVVTKIKKINKAWEERGIPIQKAGTHMIPFEMFCLHRTFNEFVKDIYSIPDKITEASEAMIPDIIDEVRNTCTNLDNNSFWLGIWRSSASFISPKQFEKFVHPYMKQTTLPLINEGYKPIFHIDGNIAPMLEYFTEYPKGTCVMALDSFTDIREAKRVVGKNMCIMGDVPPTLLCINTPQEVEKYCKDLIDDIAPGGGFIMGSGCTVPVNAKFENVKMMLDVTKTYGVY